MPPDYLHRAINISVRKAYNILFPAVMAEYYNLSMMTQTSHILYFTNIHVLEIACLFVTELFIPFKVHLCFKISIISLASLK